MQSMHHLATSLVVGSMLFLGRARACSFDTHAAQVPMSSEALTVSLPSAGNEAQQACAAMASAYGYAAASVRPEPGAGGQKVECSLHDVGQQCFKFELQEGTTTMTNISACDAASIATVTGQSVNLLQTVGEPTVIGTVTAAKRSDVAAVGGAVGTPLKASSEEDCLFACAAYVQNCATVTTGRVEGAMQCTFHSSEAQQGMPAIGSNTYDAITTTRATPALGRLAPARAAPIAEVVPLVAPMEAPFEAPFEVPLGAPPVEAPGPVAVTPEEVEFPEEVEYPEEVEIEYPEEVEVEVPEEVEAPEEVEVPEEVEMPEAEEPDAAEVPEEVSVEEPESALVIEEAGGTLQDLFTTDVEDCGPVMSEIPTGKHLPTLKAPEEAISYYGDKLKDGEFEMPYGEIEKGGEYCVSPGSTAPKVIFGGMVFWHNDDQCHLPPTKQDGSACCELFMWQPNTEGYYYDNCSMKMLIEGDGLWWFTTEMPGDESLVGWGPDPAPHIHYDFRCNGCEESGAFPGTKYQYWSKFYAREICTLEPCGGVNELEHMSVEMEGPDGETVFKYNFVLPPDIKGKF